MSVNLVLLVGSLCFIGLIVHTFIFEFSSLPAAFLICLPLWLLTIIDSQAEFIPYLRINLYKQKTSRRRNSDIND